MEDKQLFLIVAIAFITALVVSISFNTTGNPVAGDSYAYKGNLIVRSTDFGQTLDVEGENSFNVEWYSCAVSDDGKSTCEIKLNGEIYREIPLLKRTDLITGDYAFTIQSVSGYPSSEAVRVMFYRKA